MKKTPWRIVSLPSAAVLSITLIAMAPTRMPVPSPDAAKLGRNGSSVPGEAALRATIDPQTGRIEITTAPSKMILDAETRQALRRDTEGLQQTYHPNGAVSVNLRGRFQSASVARIDENGKLVICTEHADQIERITERSPTGESVPGSEKEAR